MSENRFVHYYALILAVMLLFGTAFAEETEDPVVIRVDNVTFTKSQVQSTLNTDISLSEVLGGVYLTDEEKAAQRDATMERLVGVGLIQAKLQDAGKNDFTPEEDESLKAAARNSYEQYWQGLWQKAEASDEDFSEEQITEFMQDAGYTVEAFYEEYKASERRYRAIELFCPGMILTDDMVQEYYEEQFLNPDKERYENNIDLYEEEVLAPKNESFWTPEGYRAIQQILLDYPDEVTKGLKKERARVNRAAKETADAFQTLAVAATTAAGWEEMAGPRAAYDAAAAETENAYRDYVQKREAMTGPLIQPVVDAIQTEYTSGSDFESLITKYSKDTNEMNLAGGGYPFHPESKNWLEEFTAAASALQKPGDISGPVFTDLGIHILYYASDIPAGEHILNESEKETLKTSAMNYYQGLELEKLIEEWKQEYEIEIHPELLDD